MKASTPSMVPSRSPAKRVFSDPSLIELLCSELPTLRRKVEEPLLLKIASTWPLEKRRALEQAQPQERPFQLVRLLQYTLISTMAKVDELQLALEEFQRKWDKAEDPSSRLVLLMDAGKFLGLKRRALKEDHKALDRWFSEGAVIDRFRKAIQSHLREVVILLEQTGKTVAVAVELDFNAWKNLDFEASLEVFWTYLSEPRVKVAAFEALTRAVRSLPEGKRESNLNESSLRFVYRCSLATRQDVWLQVAAMELLPKLSPETLLKALRIRLTHHHGGDDLFFRHRAVLALAPFSQSLEGAQELLLQVITDPSEHVRMALAGSLHHLKRNTHQDLLRDWTSSEQSHRVRATILLNLCQNPLAPEDLSTVADHLKGRFLAEAHPFTRRVLMKTSADLGEHYGRSGLGPQWFEAIGKQLQTWILDRKEPDQKRWGTQALARCWVWGDPWRSSFYETCRGVLSQTKLGKGKRISLPHDRHAEAFKILSLVVQEDHPIEIDVRKTSLRVFRGQSFGFRLWRTIHELRHSSPDKRQGHPHTIGRRYRRGHQFPSSVMAELSETKVPGEPLMIPEEGSWRPHLPLPDLALDALNGPWHRRETQVITLEGVTTITVPLNPLNRLWCALRLTFKLPSLAPLRNWKQGMSRAPNAYAKALKSCGVRLSFHPHDYGFGPLEDPTVRAVIDGPDKPVQPEKGES